MLMYITSVHRLLKRCVVSTTILVLLLRIHCDNFVLCRLQHTNYCSVELRVQTSKLQDCRDAWYRIQLQLLHNIIRRIIMQSFCVLVVLALLTLLYCCVALC
jgi:hypothetical protein